MQLKSENCSLGQLTVMKGATLSLLTKEEALLQTLPRLTVIHIV